MSDDDISPASVHAAITAGKAGIPLLADHFGVIPSAHTLRTVLAGLEREGLIRCAVRAGSGTTFEATAEGWR